MNDQRLKVKLIIMIGRKHFVPVIIIGLLAGLSCNEQSTPRPKGYFNIDLPEKKYLSFNQPGYPYAFEYPAYGKVMKDSTFFDAAPENPYWVNIEFPDFNAKIYLSYKEINAKNNFDLLIKDAFKMTSKHSIKATYIDEIPFKENQGVSGFIFDVGGNAATGKQFFATDSARNFLRGALYFDATPNFDSIQPAERFLYEDVLHLIKTLQWKN
jgi:gliding motility-associated lipoprotein GldD